MKNSKKKNYAFSYIVLCFFMYCFQFFSSNVTKICMKVYDTLTNLAFTPKKKWVTPCKHSQMSSVLKGTWQKKGPRAEWKGQGNGTRLGWEWQVESSLPQVALLTAWDWQKVLRMDTCSGDAYRTCFHNMGARCRPPHSWKSAHNF